MTCEELLKENEKLKKENEELRHAITGATERTEELWDALNSAMARMFVFVSVGSTYAKGISRASKTLARWAEMFNKRAKESQNVMFHSEYKGLYKCGDEMYWIK